MNIQVLALVVSATLMLAVWPIDRGAAQTDLTVFEPFRAEPSGRVSFPTRDVAGLHDLYTGEGGYNARAVGVLVLPTEAAPADPVPAMVILHGSGGEWGGRGARHAALLAQHGIASLVVDSFESRGMRIDTPYLTRLQHVNMPDQVADAYAALDALSADPRIDAARIGVMGYSMGGISAFLTAYEEVAAVAGPGDQRFALHVPFYAPCFISLTNSLTTGAPIVALWGERDESTHADACARQVREFETGGSEVTTHWLPDAAHGWNMLQPMTFVANAPHGSPCLFVVDSCGEAVESTTGRSERRDEDLIGVLSICSDRGYTMGRHDDADQAANRILLHAIRMHLP